MHRGDAVSSVGGRGGVAAMGVVLFGFKFDSCPPARVRSLMCLM